MSRKAVKPSIPTLFADSLKEFASNGYNFDAEHKSLREGTQREVFDTFANQFDPRYQFPPVKGKARLEAILSLGLETGVIHQNGASLFYHDSPLGNDRNQAEVLLRKNSEIADSIVSEIEQRKRIQDGYFEIPTGVGKTALFISLIKNFVDATKEMEERPRVLVVVPSKKLVEQTATRFTEFMPEIAKLVAQNGGDDKQEIDYKSEDTDLGAYY
jgi:hypothetical protein